MNKSFSRICAAVVVAIGAPMILLAASDIKTLVLAGRSGDVPVKQFHGKNYVEVEALAQLANGSISFNGDQMTLTLPAAANATAPESPNAAVRAGFSRDFLSAAIQEITTIQQWHDALENAIADQYPLAQAGMGRYQAQAVAGLRLMHVAVHSDSDSKGAQLISNEFQKMQQLSNDYLGEAANMNYVQPSSLSSNKLNQSVTACRQSIESMIAGGQFVDNGACD